MSKYLFQKDIFISIIFFFNLIYRYVLDGFIVNYFLHRTGKLILSALKLH